MESGPNNLGEREIMERLKSLLLLLLRKAPEHRKEIANSISEFARNVLMNKKIKLSEEADELLVGCLDLDHWGDPELPQTLSIKEIRQKIIPQIEGILKASQRFGVRIRKDS